MLAAMKSTSEQLYEEMQDARVARAGAELALRAVREEMRAIRRRRLEQGRAAEAAELEAELVALQRAVERTVHRLVGQEQEALDRYSRTPTATGLMPVCAANTNE